MSFLNQNISVSFCNHFPGCLELEFAVLEFMGLRVSDVTAVGRKTSLMVQVPCYRASPWMCTGRKMKEGLCR